MTRPRNIIVILADDLGYGDLGCDGGTIIRTPNLDRMAAEGTRLSDFYASANLCTPSRAGLLTGRYAIRLGLADQVIQASETRGLPTGELTIPKLLQPTHATALIGKWGLGDVGAAESGLPRQQGFDYFFGYLNQRHAHNHFPDFLWRNEERVPLPNRVHPVGTDGAGYAANALLFADDLFTDEALKFVANHQDRPFFLYWSLVTPHANNERNRDLKDGAHVKPAKQPADSARRAAS